MKYGIVENHKFILIDEDRQRLENTIPFMPGLQETDIVSYEDSDIEQGYDGVWYEKGHAPKKPLGELKAEKLTEINAACDSILNSAVSTYPETEVLTFDQQTSEANVYLQTKNPEDAPLLSALALGRGITLDDLVQRVIAKHTAFSVLSGHIIGQRQALEDRLDECKTVEDVEAIVVDIKLPDTSQNEEEVTEG